MVEIGAVRIAADASRPGDRRFRSLVQPGRDDPGQRRPRSMASTTPRSRGAPVFRRDLAETARLHRRRRRDRPTLGFDLAMLQRECERAGIAWSKPRTLDTAAAGAGGRAATSPAIRSSSSRPGSGSRLTERHSALGDALTTARVFQRAGAETARRRHPHLCRGGAGLPRAHRRARPAASRRLGRAGRRAGARSTPSARSSRIDSYPYRHRIRDVMSAPPRIIAAGPDAGRGVVAPDRASASLRSLSRPPDVTPERLSGR